MKNIFAAIIVAALSVPFAAVAGPNYTYLDLEYINFDSGGDAYGLDGSYGFHENFHFVASYHRASIGGFSASIWTLGAGYNYALSEETDFVGRLRLGRASGGGGSVKILELGLRSMLTDAFELNGFVVHARNGGNETGFMLGMAYHFSESMGVTFEVNDDTDFSLGLRFSF